MEETRLKIYSAHRIIPFSFSFFRKILSKNKNFFQIFPNEYFFPPTHSRMFHSFHVFRISSFPFLNLYQELRERTIETFWKEPAFLFLKRSAYISNPFIETRMSDVENLDFVAIKEGAKLSLHSSATLICVSIREGRSKLMVLKNLP